MSQHTGRVWSCFQPGCHGVNLDSETRCGSCFAERPKRSSFREALEFFRPSPAVDLEDFLRQNLQLGAPRHLAEVTLVGSELFLTLKTQFGESAHYLVQINDVTPCDGSGREGW